ncbi:MAG: hypothetical protein L3K26_18260, partial [Candidatus Hydrogenedentes bacterium]|nr:hypothetical protein [Candidatus Hydrogenedentota bacterium]
ALAHAALFDSVWACAALDKQGYGSEAERVLRFHLDTMRTAFMPSGPPGSLPAYVHTTGVPARFLDSANPASTAWLLAALWRHSVSLPPEQALKFLDTCKNSILDGGDFLARAPVVGEVLSGTMKPGAASLTTLQTHYLGLVSGQSIMARLGQNEPGAWQSRREEVYARIRFRQLDEKRVQDPESPWLAYWVSTLPEAAPSENTPWQVLLSDKSPTAAELLESVPSAGPAVNQGIPVALRAALAILDEDRVGDH